jgi:hypothetical protein
MVRKYYALEDTTNSVATLLKVDTAEHKTWLEELCNVAEVSEEMNSYDHRIYLLSYCDKKGGLRIEVDSHGRIILGGMDSHTIRQIPDEEVIKCQDKWLRAPQKKPVLS